MLDEETLLSIYKGYNSGKFTLKQAAEVYGVSMDYLWRRNEEIRHKTHSLPVKVDLIRQAEHKLIEQARMLSTGKGSIEEYRERLFYFSKANANSNYPLYL